jgi:hypothetical protein
MNRRDIIRLIPVTLSGLGSSAFTASAAETCPGCSGSSARGPQSLQYAKKIRDMLSWVRETQSEKLLESSYAVSRALRNGRTFWVNWDQGHSTNAEMFPGRNGMPLFLTHGYDPDRARDGDILMASRILSPEGFDDLAEKNVFVIGSPSPWSGDARGFERIRKDIQPMKIQPHSDIWIETNITVEGAIMKIPGIPAPFGPVSGPLYMTLMWMILADACRILSIEGKEYRVDGDGDELDGDTATWVDTADPLMDNFLDEVNRELEMIGAELGDVRRIAAMVVDTLLDGGNVYYYSRYSNSFATEATGRRGGFLFAKGLSDGNISGTSKDCVIMGVYTPDDEADLKNLDEFKRIGMRTASIGPATRDYTVPEGRTVPKETDVHVGRMCDSYGLYAIPGFNRKVCPTSGITMFALHWTIGMEIIEQIRERTGGNLPAVHSSGALEYGNSISRRGRTMQQDRGY